MIGLYSGAYSNYNTHRQRDKCNFWAEQLQKKQDDSQQPFLGYLPRICCA